MGDTTRLKRVREFIADQTGHPLGEITLSTRLVEDGGVDGDDAVELMEAFMEDFHVEMSGFRFKQHFGPEAGDPLLGVFLGVAIATSLAQESQRVWRKLHEIQAKKQKVILAEHSFLIHRPLVAWTY